MATKAKAANKPAVGKKAAKSSPAAQTKDGDAKPASKKPSPTPEMMKRLGTLLKTKGGDAAALEQLIVESSSFESAAALAKKALEQKSEWESAKETAKGFKKRYEATLEEITALLSGNAPELPFDADVLRKTVAPAKSPPAAGASPDEYDKALAAATLKEIGLKDKQIALLEADGIKTGADVHKWRAEFSPHKVQGVSDEAGRKIGDALCDWSIKWLAAHPAPGGGAPPTRKAEPVGDDELALARGKLESAIFGRAESLAGADGKNSAADKIGRYLTGSADAGGAISKAPLGLVREWQAALNGAGDGDLQDIIAGKTPGKSAAAA